MDILNTLPQKRFRQLDDLLAFISIYDDRRRTKSYLTLLHSFRKRIAGSVCVEGGCGLGIFSAELARLGARKVYAVEQNPLLAQLCRKRFDRLPKHLTRQIELIVSPLQDFRPPVPVNVLVHEFYGQLLYDEDLWVLGRLKFDPDVVLPDGGELRAGVVRSVDYFDRVVTGSVIEKLDNVLVSGLFREKLSELQMPVLRWKFGKGLSHISHSFKQKRGDLACFGVVITHRGKTICEAGRCPNWSYVWTARKGNSVSFRFRRDGEFMDCRFSWRD